MADVLGTAVGVISLGIQVADGLIKYYTAYKDREADTAHTVKRLTNLLNLFESLRLQLASRTFQPDEQSLLEVIERSVGDCEELIGELQRETDKFTQTSSSAGVTAAARTVGRRLAYPFRQSTLQKLDEDIDEICAHLTIALQVLQQKDLGSVQDELQDIKELLELVRASQVSAEVQNWLRAPDASINYNDACKKKHAGTGLWLIKSPQFTTWLTSPNSFLWLNGFAGCGKSVLSSTVVQHTFRHRRSNPRVGIAFFYFTFNDESKQDTSAMLRALILQLVSQLGVEQEVLSPLMNRYRGATPPDQALLDCLRQCINKLDDVYLVLDALDESPRHQHREDVLQALEDMRGWSETRLHLLVTSRDEQDVRESLNPPDNQVVPMKNSAIDADIASFVAGHLKSNRRLRKWEKYHAEIERALTEGAKGVFRWVECQFAALEACPCSKTRLNALLGSLPRTLDKTYERMLHNIDEDSVDDARRVLILLCTAKRPLYIREVIDGIAVELGENPRLNEDSRLLNEDDIRHICPGFIEVDCDPLDDGGDWSTARIAHYSVQEFLEADRIKLTATARFHMDRVEANTDMASICLAYILHPGLWKPLEQESSRENYPLVEYAVSLWVAHYLEGNSNDAHLHGLALQLFRNVEGAFVFWLNRSTQGIEPASWINKTVTMYQIAAGMSPLTVAAALGLDPLVRTLLPAADSVTSTAYRNKRALDTALIAATMEGCASTVHLLLEHGADVNYVGSEGAALHAAAESGDVAIMKALLQRGAEVGAQSPLGETPLFKAVLGGRAEAVRLLLDNGADPNNKCLLPREAAVCRLRNTSLVMDPLHSRPDAQTIAAARAEREKLPPVALLEAERVKLKDLVQAAADPLNGLISKHIEAGFVDPRHRTPLEAAVGCGQVENLAILLDRGADVDEAGGYGNLLQMAAYSGSFEIVRFLLDKGADVNGGKSRTSLENGVHKSEGGARSLFVRQVGDGTAAWAMTPLQAAVFGGQSAAVSALLSRGADANLGILLTPLKMAASRGLEEIFRVLLENGAQPGGSVKRTEPDKASEQVVQPRDGSALDIPEVAPEAST